MRNLDLRVCKGFIAWHLNQRVGKNGRRKRGTKITRSLRTWWDQFRLLFQREMLSDIDWQVNRNAVNNVSTSRLKSSCVDAATLTDDCVQLLEICFQEFNLSSERKENRPMTLEDLKLQIETTLSTTEKAFKVGEQRILAVLFLLLLAPAGARPDSILKIQYRHLDIALHQPKDGPAQLVIYVKLEFTKSYQGSKPVYVRPFLLCCPQNGSATKLGPSAWFLPGSCPLRQH